MIFKLKGTDRTVQYKLNAQSPRLFGFHRDVNDAHRAGSNRLPKQQKIVLLHGCSMCLVGFGLLDSVDKGSAAPFVPRKQVASLHAGWTEIPKRFVDGLVSYNETRCSCVKMQTESSVFVTQSVGGCVWLGWTRCSERHLPSWTYCNPVA